MNTSTSHRSRTSQFPTRNAGAVPVTQLCEIACIVFCRIVVPKLTCNVNLPSEALPSTPRLPR